MTMWPKIESDIRQYMNLDKQLEIIEAISCFYEKKKICINNVCFDRNENLCKDKDGYVNNNKNVLGRYISNEKKIVLNEESLPDKVNKLFNKMNCKDESMLFCDLVFIHECMHAYQDQVEGAMMKRGDKYLEDDANQKAISFLKKTYKNSQEIKDEIIKYYMEKFTD